MICKRIIESSKKPPCPECGGRMTLRERRADAAQFWGCVNYPDCKGTVDIEGEDEYDNDYLGFGPEYWKDG